MIIRLSGMTMDKIASLKRTMAIHSLNLQGVVLTFIAVSCVLQLGESPIFQRPPHSHKQSLKTSDQTCHV